MSRGDHLGEFLAELHGTGAHALAGLCQGAVSSGEQRVAGTARLYLTYDSLLRPSLAAKKGINKYLRKTDKAVYFAQFEYCLHVA